MRAIVMTEQGASPRLTELPSPTANDGEVLVRVGASSVNGFDMAVAAGHLAGMMEHRFPVVLGKDFAGTVEVVGARVSRFAVGDQVFGVVSKPFLGDGGFGDYVVVGEQIGIAKLPKGLDMRVAGALGLAGTAAVDALDAVKPQAGETVLVSGATGGVGAIAVQYAAATGARVIATAQPGAEANFVRGLGATNVVDRAGDLAAQVRAIAPDGVDVVLHFAGDGVTLASLLSEKGRLASTLGFGAGEHPAAAAVMAAPTETTLDRLAADAAAGRITVPIGRTFTLADVPAAFADFALGTIGKISIAVTPAEPRDPSARPV